MKLAVVRSNRPRFLLTACEHIFYTNVWSTCIRSSQNIARCGRESYKSYSMGLRMC